MWFLIKGTLWVLQDFIPSRHSVLPIVFLVTMVPAALRSRSFLVITTYFSRNNDMCRYNRYTVGLRWASVRAAQSDINEDLHAAELKYTVLNIFNVMVLIIAACLLGLMSNTTLSNNSTQTHDLFRLYMIRSKQLFLNNWLWAWNIYLFEWLKFDWTTNRNMNKDK